MKRSSRAVEIALSLVLLLAPLVVRGQGSEWRWLTGGNLKAVKFIGQQGWIIGDDGNQGIILHTTDGGDTWAIQPHNTGKHYFNGLCVKDSQNVWIAGGNRGMGEPGFMLRTRNGGNTWTFDSCPTPYAIQGISYIDTTRGWLSCDVDTVFKTTDSGRTWAGTQVGNSYYGIVFKDSLHGWGSGGGVLGRTTDGGRTWIEIIGSGGPLIDMWDTLVGWTSGAFTQASRTTDGGITWTFQPIPLPTSAWIYGLSVIDTSNVLVVGGGPATIAKTTNGGTSWDVDSSLTNDLVFQGVQGLPSNLSWVVGQGGVVLKSTNLGILWRVVVNTDISTRTFINLDFINSQSGWAVGTYGAITHTTNGGTVWQLQKIATQPFLYGVDLPDTQNGQKGWICGEGGLVLATTNAGNGWLQQTSNTTMPLFSLDFADTAYGVAVGGYYGPPEPPKPFGSDDSLKLWGTGLDFWKYPWRPEETALTTPYRAIIRTSNGGALWIAQNTTGQVPLYGVSFVTPREGWACGDPQGGMGVILHTTDSGATWTGQSSNVNRGLYWIQFRNSQTGWCVGSNGTALWTTDGGTTWNQGNTGITSVLWSCAFYNNLNGFACGNNGLLIKTVDGGRNWTPDTSKVYANLTAVNALDSTHAWSVGSFGMVLGWRMAGVSGVEQRGPDKDRDFASLNRIKAYPNPFISFARVAGHEKEKFALYDVSGRRVGSYTGERIGADIGSGVYFLMAEDKAAGPVRIVKVK